MNRKDKSKRIIKRNKKEKMKGITLLSLIITIIVLLILAGISFTTLWGDNGILTKASKAKLATELAKYKEEFEMFKLEKSMEDLEFQPESIVAGEEVLIYNTKPETEQGNIKTILKDMEEKWSGRLEVIKGELILNTTDKTEIEVAQNVGIQPNPYIIVNGELLSSEYNLALMDETGTVTIPSTVDKIGSGAFRGLEGLRTIVIPATCKEIGSYAFSGNSTLEKVIIENGVEKIGEYAFQDCKTLKEIEMPDSIVEVGSTCFGNCSSLKKVKISKNLDSIPMRMFSVCSSLENIEIPDGVTKIEGAAFEQCNLIKEIKIPSSVTSIDAGAFSGMNSLTNIDFTNNTVYSFQNGMILSLDKTILYGALSNLKQINLLSTITTIKSPALLHCNYLTSLKIPKSVISITLPALPNNLNEIIVEEGNAKYKSINGNLYDYNIEVLIKYYTNETTVTLPDTVKIIKNRAFTGQDNIQNLILPDSLEQIENFALEGMGITELNIPKNVNTIYSLTFSGVNIDVTISEENTKYMVIDNIYIINKNENKLEAISKKLDNYNIPENIEIIGSHTFYANTKLKSIIIPDNVKIIENSAFDYATSLQRIEIHSSIEVIGSTAFSRCKNLTEIIIHKEERSVPDAPWGCPYGLRAVKWEV